MSPGIEPGNLIRSTLIRSPPGAFFFCEKLSNEGRMRYITKRSRKYSFCLLLTVTAGIETKAELTKKMERKSKIKKTYFPPIFGPPWLRLVSFYLAVYGFNWLALSFHVGPAGNKLTHPVNRHIK